MECSERQSMDGTERAPGLVENGLLLVSVGRVEGRS
jgi:hypothetical protein